MFTGTSLKLEHPETLADNSLAVPRAANPTEIPPSIQHIRIESRGRCAPERSLRVLCTSSYCEWGYISQHQFESLPLLSGEGWGEAKAMIFSTNSSSFISRLWNLLFVCAVDCWGLLCIKRSCAALAQPARNDNYFLGFPPFVLFVNFVVKALKIYLLCV